MVPPLTYIRQFNTYRQKLGGRWVAEILVRDTTVQLDRKNKFKRAIV